MTDEEFQIYIKLVVQCCELAWDDPRVNDFDDYADIATAIMHEMLS